MPFEVVRVVGFVRRRSFCYVAPEPDRVVNNKRRSPRREIGEGIFLLIIKRIGMGEDVGAVEGFQIVRVFIKRIIALLPQFVTVHTIQ